MELVFLIVVLLLVGFVMAMNHAEEPSRRAYIDKIIRSTGSERQRYFMLMADDRNLADAVRKEEERRGSAI
jgi:hypothetical protein